ncbi:MAG: trypsin-like peptidase domain-containing protein [Acidobacteriota bacterium]
MVNPAVAVQPSCPISRRCHVGGRGIKDFAGKFSSKMIQELATSSVALMVQEPGKTGLTFIASGTLIRDNVVLCAAHSVANQSDQDIQILLFFECDAKTAPPGHRSQYDKASLPNWQNCQKLRTKPQAKVIKALERGDSVNLDFVLFAIEWTEFKPSDAVAGLKIVEVPRLVHFPPPSGTPTKHAVLVSHPQNEGTQASVGLHIKIFGPNPQTQTGTDYGYATVEATTGSSGGGIFNESGQMIGVLKGTMPGQPGVAFLNLDEAQRKTLQSAPHLPENPHLRRWFEVGDPLLPGDPKENVTFKVVP